MGRTATKTQMEKELSHSQAEALVRICHYLGVHAFSSNKKEVYVSEAQGVKFQTVRFIWQAVTLLDDLGVEDHFIEDFKDL